jgi:hypothetical protein
MSNDNPTTVNKASRATQKHWATWVLDIFVAIGAISQVAIGIVLIHQLHAYKSSNRLTRRSLELTRNNLDLTSKSVALTQKSTELSQKTIELTQKSVEATQEALKYASKANEISQKGLEAANTAWVDVRIKDVSRFSKDRMDINYYIENHSGSPATGIFAECYLETSYGIDENAFSESNIAIMPNQTVETHSRILVIMSDPKTLVNEINDGKMGIKVYVFFFNAMGKKASFIETFYKIRGRFTNTDTQFNPSQADVFKLIKGSTPR